MSSEDRNPPKRWLSLGARALGLLIALLVALDLWAVSATDPDYYLPDAFRPIALALVFVFVASGLLRVRALRRGIRLLASVIVVATLIFEVQSRFRDVLDRRVERASDPILRYRYRPLSPVGRPAGSAQPSADTPTRINHLGLWDREYAIPKPTDVYRVVVLTGSIGNDGSIPFSSRFHEVLERNLATLRPDGRRIEVINASCDGYNTTQEVRLLERIGLQYQPDFVIVAYMLTSATLQNGAYRRIGNSFFAFRFLPMIASARSGSMCSLFAPFHEGYSFELVVRNALERLALLRRLHGFRTLVAVLPVLERFDDPVCSAIYDHVVRTAREAGHDTLRVADAFAGEDFRDYVKPGARMDLCHPNERGHAKIAKALETALRAALQKSE